MSSGDHSRLASVARLHSQGEWGLAHYSGLGFTLEEGLSVSGFIPFSCPREPQDRVLYQRLPMSLQRPF